MKIIGERLRGLRESVRLSQAKLAKEFDVSQSALARYEIDDSTPSPEVFLKYADYFDVDRKSTRLNSSHLARSRMPSSA